MTLKETIKEDLKEAMRNHDEAAKNTLKGLLSAFTNELVANGKTPRDDLTEDEEMRVVKRMEKQRKDAISKFSDGGRDDLVQSEQAELKILEKYLPEKMNEGEILEVKRRSQLTEFERAIEDFNKKRELIQKNLSEQILAITIKKNTAIEAFNAEEEKFKEYQKTMRAEQTKTTLNWLRMLAIKEQASGDLKGKEKADKFYQEAGIGYRLGEIVKDSSIGIAEWLTGKQSTWQTAGEIIIEREREEMKKTTNNFNINIQKKISEAGDNEEVLNEIMNEVKKYLDQAK